MNSEVWGPGAWTFLHSITFTYPHKPDYNTRRHFYEFFNNLQNVLPCNICMKHYKKHLEEFPLMEHLDSKDHLIRWLINIHNRINKLNGKRNYSYEDVIKYYDKLYEHPSVYIKKKYTVLIITLIFFLLICMYYIYIHKKK